MIVAAAQIGAGRRDQQRRKTTVAKTGQSFALTRSGIEDWSDDPLRGTPPDGWQEFGNEMRDPRGRPPLIRPHTLQARVHQVLPLSAADRKSVPVT